MDPNDYGRFNNDVMFLVPAVFPTIVIFSVPFMAREDAAAGREQGGNAY
jgi:hypothetical protein